MRLPLRPSSVSLRFLFFLYLSPDRSCCHHFIFKIWANGLPRDNAGRHAHHRAVAGYIRNHQRICADHNVIAEGHSAHHFTTGAEVNIVAKSGPTGAPDTADTDTLIKCTTMADPFGENKDAGAIMDHQSRSNFALPVKVNTGNGQTKRIDDQVNSNHQLTRSRNFQAVSPAAEAMHDYGQRSEFEQWRNALPEKSLILRPNAVSADFAVEIGTNRFKHIDQFLSTELFEIAEGLKALLNFG